MNSTDGTTSSSKKGGTPSKMTCALLSRQYKGTTTTTTLFFLILVHHKINKTELSSEPPSGVDVWLRDDDEYEDDIFHWECSIVGPPDTLLYVVSDRDQHTLDHTHNHTHKTVKEEFLSHN